MKMTTNTGYAVEYEDGTKESVYNLATAKYLVSSGMAKRIYDTYFQRYVVPKLPDNKTVTHGVSV
jgi:hypothetical protein